MIGQAKRMVELSNLKAQNSFAKKNIFAVTSGKGGTGKSFFILNLAFQLSNLNKKVLLIDLDSNLANIDVMLNETSEITIGDFLQNRVLFKELPKEVKPNLEVIFGDSGKLKLPEKRREIIDYMFSSIRNISSNYDFIFIDTGAGVQSDGLYLLSKIDEILLVVNPDPTSVMDGYAFTKLFFNEYAGKKIGVVVNKCDDETEGKQAFENINTATTHFLRVELKNIGIINYHPDVYKSIKEQTIFTETNSESLIAMQINSIGEKIVAQLKS